MFHFMLIFKKRIHSKLIVLGFLSMFPITCNVGMASAFDFVEAAKDTFFIGAAYTTHLFFHEAGHQIVADDVGAKDHRMNFFTTKNGKFYPGLSTYQSIPEKSKLPYSLGGERMAGYTFEYALDSYRRKPTTYNKALMFFSSMDFLFYTALANYVESDNDMYDPNIIREETGVSKGTLIGMVALKSLLNVYRIMDKDADFIPRIEVDKDSAYFMIGFHF